MLYDAKDAQIIKVKAFTVMLLLLAMPRAFNCSSLKEAIIKSVEFRTALNSPFNDRNVLFAALEFCAKLFSSKPGRGVESFLAKRNAR